MKALGYPVSLMLAALVCTHACQATVGATPKHAASGLPATTTQPSPGPVSPVGLVSAGTSAVASTGPSEAHASPPVSATGDGLAEPRKLRKPTGETNLLSGVVTIDASYLTATGGGNFLSHNGSAIVASGGGNFLSHNGSAVVVQDAGYIVAQGGGNVISPNGSNVISPNGSNVISPNGSNIIGINGGNIVAQGGGNFLSHNGAAIVASGGGNVIAEAGLNLLAAGGSLVAEGGGAIVAQGGGNIVAQGGGNIVAQGGGNIVAQGGGNLAAQGNRQLVGFHVLDNAGTSPASPLPAADVGVVLPAVGMRISVLSLDTNTPVPIGQDEAGRPVYTVYTNAEGHYDLYLPAAEAGNVRVVANVRNVPAGDNPLADPNPRYRYDIVNHPGSDGAVDEDTEEVSRFLLDFFSSQMVPFLVLNLDRAGFEARLAESFDRYKITGLLRSSVLDAIVKLNTAGKEAGLREANPAVAAALARSIARQALAGLTLDSVTVTRDSSPYYPLHVAPNDQENALVAMKQIFGDARKKAANFLPPVRVGYIEHQSFFESALCRGYIPRDFRIERPSDVSRFINQAYLTREVVEWEQISQVLSSIGANTLPANISAPGAFQADRLQAATTEILKQMLIKETLQTDRAVAYLKAPHPNLLLENPTGSATQAPAPEPICAP
jgi:hypothetical protein